MSLESHLAQLQRKHGEVDAEIAALASSPSADDLTIVDLKRRKLKLKEEITRLQSGLH